MSNNKTKIDPQQNSDRLDALKLVMSGVDPTIEAGLVNFGFFLKDRRVWIIDESRIIQGAKIYTSYLPGDTFAICLQKGSEKKKVCVRTYPAG